MHGQDVLGTARDRLDFLAKPSDVHVHGPRGNSRVVSPHLMKELLTRERGLTMFDEVLEVSLNKFLTSENLDRRGLLRLRLQVTPKSYDTRENEAAERCCNYLAPINVWTYDQAQAISVCAASDCQRRRVREAGDANGRCAGCHPRRGHDLRRRRASCSSSASNQNSGRPTRTNPTKGRNLPRAARPVLRRLPQRAREDELRQPGP
jgi:hypothetical protein